MSRSTKKKLGRLSCSGMRLMQAHNQKYAGNGLVKCQNERSLEKLSCILCGSGKV